MDLKQTLKLLEHNNDEHWTTEGLPVIAVVSALLGRQVTRKEITEMDPTFSRQTSVEEEQDIVEEAQDPLKLVAKYDQDIAALDRTIKDCRLEVERLTREREILREEIRNEYDYKSDQERRMDHIKKGNARRYADAMARQEALKNIDPRILAKVGAPIDLAAKNRRDHKPMIPHRVFEQRKSGE